MLFRCFEYMMNTYIDMLVWLNLSPTLHLHRQHCNSIMHYGFVKSWSIMGKWTCSDYKLYEYINVMNVINISSFLYLLLYFMVNS